MSPYARSTTRLPGLACLSAAIALGLLALPAPPAAAQTTTTAQQSQSFDIPAQPLSDAIRRFSRLTGLRVAYDSALGQGVRSNAVNGDYIAETALRRLLEGTGLGYRIERGVISLEKASAVPPEFAPPSAADPQGNATTFPRLEVRGQRPEGYTVQSSSSAALLDLAIKDTPQVVHVMTEQRIKDQNLTQVAEVLTQAPGFTASQSGIPGAGHIQYYARGFPVTNIMLDGVTTSGNGFNDWDVWGLLDTAVYERVELVQGSTGLSTGAGDPSASVNFVRKRPTATAQGTASLGYGSWNQVRGTLDVSGPLNDAGSVRGRLVGAWQQGDSWQDRVHGRMGTLYGVTEWDASDSTRVTLGALHTDMRADDVTPWGINIGNDRNADGESDFLALGRDFNPATDWSYATLSMTSAFARIEQDLGENWKARANYEFMHIDSDRMWGMIGRYSAAGLVTGETLGYDWGRSISKGDIHNLDASVSGKFQWRGHEQQLIVGLSGYRGRIGGPMYYEMMPSWGPHALIAGNCAGGTVDSFFGPLPAACWNNGNVPLPTAHQGPYSLLPGLLDFTGPYNDILTGDYSRWTATQKQYGGYASLRLQPFERLSMILGGRYNRWERQSKMEIYILPINRPMYPDVVGDWTTSELADDGQVTPAKKFIPYAGLVFDLTPQMTAYASYTGIYRPNTDNNWVGTPYFRDAEGKALPPVEGDSKEVGVKGAFFDGQLNTQLTVFQMQQENHPIRDFPETYVPTPQGDGYMQCSSSGACSYAHTASPGIRSRGVELSVEGRLGESWNLAASWTHGRLDFKDPSTGQWYPCGTRGAVYNPTGVCTSNMSFMLPKNQVKLFGTWSYRQLTLGAGAVWKQSTKYYPCQTSNCTPEMQKPVGFLTGSYAVVDVLARYAFSPRVSLSANVGNLFDRHYVTSNGEFFWGAPRNAMLTFEYALF